MSFAHHLTISGNHISLETIYKDFDRGNHSRLEQNALPEKPSPEDMERALRGMKMVYQGTDHLDLYTNLKPDDVKQFIQARFPDVQIELKEHKAKMAPFKQFKITGDSGDLEAVYKMFGNDGFFGLERGIDANGKLTHLIVHHQIHPVRIEIQIQKAFPNVKFSQ